MTQNKKISLGQFFTKKDVWLKPQVRDFILSTKARIAVDPFAGDGHLLAVVRKLGISRTIGFDIDTKLPWKLNDSLIAIPKVADAIIITNPPYLTNYSAKRKGSNIFQAVEKYFSMAEFTDLYQLALQNCLASSDYVVAIVPETFLNSTFSKERLMSVTVLEENPFHDTDCPVCVLCFDQQMKPLSRIHMYKNGSSLPSLGELEIMRLRPRYDIPIRYNVVHGNIALRAVDTTDPEKPIKFMPVDKLDYHLSGIKYSSRLITIIQVDIPKKNLLTMITECNRILTEYRRKTHDVTLSPFKGNTKVGIRRRRLDYYTARAILEQAYRACVPQRFLRQQLSLLPAI